jgi:L-alanine-DL-glutamate epimerase-like enolase superfamily enzyme
MVDAGREMAKAVPVPVLSLTGGPVRVARVQVATETPAAGQSVAEAIREGEDVGGGAQDADATTQAPEVCKDANCRNPAHGHPPEAAKSLPAHLEID